MSVQFSYVAVYASLVIVRLEIRHRDKLRLWFRRTMATVALSYGAPSYDVSSYSQFLMGYLHDPANFQQMYSKYTC